MARHMRVARPTDQLEAVTAFYRDGLGFQLIGSFENHDGFDGVILGHPDHPWHLEFTHERNAPAGGAPSPEHLLVFYYPNEANWEAAIARMAGLGHHPVEAHNPYWERMGCTFEDPDGYRVVLQNAEWHNTPHVGDRAPAAAHSA